MLYIYRRNEVEIPFTQDEVVDLISGDLVLEKVTADSDGSVNYISLFHKDFPDIYYLGIELYSQGKGVYTFDDSFIEPENQNDLTNYVLPAIAIDLELTLVDTR